MAGGWVELGKAVLGVALVERDEGRGWTLTTVTEESLHYGTSMPL